VAEPASREILTLLTSKGAFELQEKVTYPNGATSSFYRYGSVTLIVDDGICEHRDGEPVFDYSLITNKQNEYVAKCSRVYRFLRDDLDEGLAEVERFLAEPAGEEESPGARKVADRAELAEPSPLERAFEEHFANVYGEDAPRIVIVEPDKADCIYRTALANDEQLHIVTGDMDTIMAGLACGEPNRIGWEVLRDYADVFVSCPDWAAAEGMRILASPAGEDDRVTAGESGASAFGCAAAALRWGALKGLKDALGLDENSRLLFFNTEGDTDKENYRRIVWDGAWPAPWNE